MAVLLSSAHRLLLEGRESSLLQLAAMEIPALPDRNDTTVTSVSEATSEQCGSSAPLPLHVIHCPGHPSLLPTPCTGLGPTSSCTASALD